MMRPEIVFPVIMGCALLWWIGRGMTLSSQLVVVVVTLVLIAAILAFERSTP